MSATHVQAVTSPLGWAASPTAGVWIKELITAAPSGGDGFVLIRLAPGAETVLEVSDLDRFLVVSGSVEFHGEEEPVAGRSGDYLAPAGSSVTVRATEQAAVVLRLTGPRLGGSSSDAYGPDGWFPAGPGVWAKLFVPLPADLSTFDERIAGLTWFEPGAVSDRHPHPTAHRFLFLAGHAHDEMIFPDGRRETIDRWAGDFVDYPTGIDHRTHTPGGCTLLFVHEARTAS